jgi:hypothetical protein
MYSTEIADKVMEGFLNSPKSEQIRCKRLRGLRVDNIKTEDKIHFFAMFPEEVPRSRYVNDVILTGLSAIALQNGKAKGVKLYEALAEAYYDSKNPSDSFKRDIECFVQGKAEYNMTFFHDFWKLYQRLQKEKDIDILGMVHDLIFWDDKKTKEKYVNELVFYKERKKNTRSEKEIN